MSTRLDRNCSSDSCCRESLSVHAPISEGGHKSIITGDPDPEDVKRYFRALRRAQLDLDVNPGLYTHHYKKEFPAHFIDQMDTKRWGPGERIVFEPYSRGVYERSYEWIAEHKIFPEGEMGSCEYDQATVSLAD